MPMFKKSLLILLVLAAAVLFGTMYGYYTQQQSTIALDEGTLPKEDPLRTVTVYVTGEVKKPGLVTLNEG